MRALAHILPDRYTWFHITFYLGHTIEYVEECLLLNLNKELVTVKTVKQKFL